MGVLEDAVKGLAASNPLAAAGATVVATNQEKGKFGATPSSSMPVVVEKPGMVSNLTSLICIAVALYFATKCKINGRIDPLQIVLAVCCTPFYICYRVVRPC
jgi:hypothetical protein